MVFLHLPDNHQGLDYDRKEDKVLSLGAWLNPYLHIWDLPCRVGQGTMVYPMNSALIQKTFNAHVIGGLPRDGPPVPFPSWTIVVTITPTNPQLMSSRYITLLGLLL